MSISSPEPEASYEIDRLPRATLEQKIAILEFYHSNIKDLTRGQLVHLFNKRISISNSSFSEWLKREDELKLKFLKNSEENRKKGDILKSSESVLNHLLLLQSTNQETSLQQNVISTDFFDRTRDGQNDGSVIDTDGSRTTNSHQNEIFTNNQSSQTQSNNSSVSMSFKKPHKSKYDKMNKLMDKMVIKRKSENLPITEGILKEYWAKYAKTCDITDPKRSQAPSNGWLDHFKNRHHLKAGIMNINAQTGVGNLKSFKQEQEQEQMQNRMNQINSIPDSSNNNNNPTITVPTIITTPAKKFNNQNTTTGFTSTHSGNDTNYPDTPLLNEAQAQEGQRHLGSDTSNSTPGPSIAQLNNESVYMGNNSLINRVNSTNFLNGVKLFPSSSDFLKDQKSTDSFYKIFGSAMQNNGAAPQFNLPIPQYSTTTLEGINSVNAFLREQQQQQQGQLESKNKDQNDNNNSLAFQEANPFVKVEPLKILSSKRPHSGLSSGDEEDDNDNGSYVSSSVSPGIQDVRLLNQMDDDDQNSDVLQMEVPRDFTSDEVERVFSVHCLRFLRKNVSAYPNSLNTLKVLINTFRNETVQRADQNIFNYLEERKRNKK